MIRRGWQGALFGVIVALACGLVQADEPSGNEPSGKDGWNDLFNGRDLAGWTFIGHEGPAPTEATWSVVDSTLVCSGQPIGYLRTDKTYRNYVLRLEWRFNPDRGPGNSGVLLRAQAPDKVWPRSLEAQLESRHAGDIWNIDKVEVTVDPARTMDRRTVKLHESNERPLGQWNHYEIIVDGGELTITVNELVQNTATGFADQEGWIGLQSEGAEIHFRHVRLKELP